jgi:cullin-associated NEDD8-dissociated protein 1
MESAYTRINPLELFDRVIAGLEDEHEIRVLCNLMLTKLIVLDPEEMIRRLDSIAERFRVVLSFKPKENAVKQEVEKANEASKGVLKVTVLLNNAFSVVASSSTNLQGQGWKIYIEWVAKDFRAQFHAMEQEVKDQAT